MGWGFLFIYPHMQSMASKIDLENIIKKADIFRCIKHKKNPVLKIDSDFILIQACCDNFHDHIESFIERQIELATNEENQEQL
jgi:hypothetical protein